MVVHPYIIQKTNMKPLYIMAVLYLVEELNMDESKEYQEMCNALPEEIVKEFETVIGSINDVGSVAVLDNGDVGYIGTHVIGWQVHGYDCSGDDTPVTRLYTQNQLQDLNTTYARRTYNWHDWTDMEMVREILSVTDVSYYDSFEQLYLCELLGIHFDMKWSECEKKWVQS